VIDDDLHQLKDLSDLNYLYLINF